MMGLRNDTTGRPMTHSARTLALTSLIGSLLTAGAVGISASSAGAAPTDLANCTGGGPRPCVVSVERNGSPVSGEWGFMASYDAGAEKRVSFTATKGGAGGYDLGSDALQDRWEVELDMGTVVPRVVTGKGAQAVVERTKTTGSPDTYMVTVSANPVTVSGQCDQSVWPWTCKEWSADPDPSENGEWLGYLDFQVTDYGTWDDVAQRNAMYGMNYFTNVAATSVPPQVVRDATTDSDYLMLELANRHLMEDGVTVVLGQVELRIPNSFLRVAYDVPNPATMTSGSLKTTVSGSTAGAGDVAVTQEEGADAMLVDIDNMTFSARRAHIRRGVITPTAPQGVTAARTSGQRGRLSFTAATPRGAAVTGYQARCVLVKGTHVASGSASASPVVVTGFRSGKPYNCKVRATSKAGPGGWSATVRMPSRP